jgi:hypothetical protein
MRRGFSRAGPVFSGEGSDVVGMPAPVFWESYT